MAVCPLSFVWILSKGLLVEDVTDGCEYSMCGIHLQYVDRRLGHRAIKSRWFNLQKYDMGEGKMTKQAKCASRIHMRICLEGGYHVLDESPHYSTALRPTAKQLWKKSIGILEFGILSAHGLTPMKIKDGRPTTDAYCVAKYGTKWGQSGRIQVLVGDLATLGERVESLLSWRDPIATFLFVMFCLIAAIVLYATPFYVVVTQSFIYVLYHQKILPSVLINFFRRLPTRTDSILCEKLSVSLFVLVSFLK
ncbi:putative phosphoribosyltransferase [Helianthus anomalus]